MMRDSAATRAQKRLDRLMTEALNAKLSDAGLHSWHDHSDWRDVIDGAKGHTHDGYFHIHMPDDSIVYSVIVRPPEAAS